MKTKIVLASLIGSLSVYSTMAACTNSGRLGSGGTGGVAQGGKGGSSGTAQGGQGGQGGTSGNGGKDDAGLMDVLMDAMPDAAADPVSGTRLKAKYITGDDGSKAYLPGVWYDSERQEDCTFVRAADGQQRCLPTANTVTISPTYFSDVICTHPIASAPTGCTPQYVVSYDAASCSGADSLTYHLHAISVAMNLATLYSKGPGGCTGSAAPAGYKYYAPQGEVPAASFVGGTVKTDP